MGETFDESSNKSVYKLPDWSRHEDNAVDIERLLDRCKGDDPHPVTDRACLRDATKDWDGQLNNVYQSLLSDLGPRAKISLLESERQWIKFQQSEEKTINGLLNKPDSNVAFERARMQLHKTRADELRVPASAYDVPEMGQPTESCMAKAGSVKEENSCYTRRLDIAEGNLKGTYELLLSKLNPKEQSLLKTSQGEWRKFQSKETAYLDNLHPQVSSAVNVRAIAAKMQIIENRTSQFDFFLRNHQRGR